jgi:hypothetical protein
MQIEKCVRGVDHAITNIWEWQQWAPPQKGHAHWVDGRSAKECARAWCPDGVGPRVPDEIVRLLNSHPDLVGWDLEKVTPEHVVSFDPWGGPRHSDLAGWGSNGKGHFCLHVEAKADESFDELVGRILDSAARKIANDENTNVVSRVQGLAASLLPARTPNGVKLGDLRYQLLTAVAGLLADALKSEVRQAVFVVQEFSSKETRQINHERNRRDLDNFVACLSRGQVQNLVAEKLEGPFKVPGMPLFENPAALYIGKVECMVF